MFLIHNENTIAGRYELDGLGFATLAPVAEAFIMRSAAKAGPAPFCVPLNIENRLACAPVLLLADQNRVAADRFGCRMTRAQNPFPRADVFANSHERGKVTLAPGCFGPMGTSKP